MKAFNAGDAKTAAELFDDNDWKAAAHYRAGNYEESGKLLAAPDNSNAYYNKGNVLAKLGNYQEAIKAYDEALNMNPDNEDARFNRELVKKALEQQQQQSQDSPEQPQKDQQQQQQSQDQSQQPQQDQSSQQQQDDQSAEQQADNQNKQDQLSDINENRNDNRRDKQDRKQPEAQQSEQQNSEEQLQAQQQDEALEREDAETVENEQAMEQWLRRIPDDPGGLMRRKFIYQYRQMPNQAEAKEPW